MNDTYIHKIFYYEYKDNCFGIIPSMDIAFTIDNTNKLPSAIISDKKPIFHESFKAKKRIKRVFVLTNSCNLQCSYCFEGSNHNISSSLSISDIKNNIENMFDEAEKSKKKLISYSLFGGEPTINWEAVENAIKITEELEIKTNIKCYKAIVTNGVMEDFKSDFLSKHFDFIYFSLDGPKDLFVKQRKSNNADKLYDIIYNNAKKIYNTGTYLSFKITVTSFTIDYLKEIDDFFADNFPTCSRLYQPCMVDENDILYIDFSYFLEKYLDLKRYSIFPKNMMNSLYKNKPSDRFCNLSIRNVIYPNGDVLSCHRSNMCIPEDKVRAEFYVGFWKDGVIYRDSEKHDYMKMFKVDNIEDCKNCIFKYHCCGGCPTIKLLFKNANMFRKSDYCESMLKYSYTLLISRLFNVDIEYIRELPIHKTVEKNEVSEQYFKDSFFNNIITIEE